MIILKQVSKHYPTTWGKDALKEINLSIQAQDIFGIIGESGAGKSTLLKLISLLEPASSGEILVDGKNIFAFNQRERMDFYKKMGIVFQGYHLLLQKTVFENVAFPLTLTKQDKSTIQDTVTELLNTVGLWDKKDAYPSQLSGGQKQRVAIARALANQPKILLCDEPTSALDPMTTQSILQLLQKINQQYGITIVIITHDILAVKQICHHVAVLDQGNLVESGLVSHVSQKSCHPATQRLFGKEILP